jgi:hypothetical protein
LTHDSKQRIVLTYLFPHLLDCLYPHMFYVLTFLTICVLTCLCPQLFMSSPIYILTFLTIYVLTFLTIYVLTFLTICFLTCLCPHLLANLCPHLLSSPIGLFVSSPIILTYLLNPAQHDPKKAKSRAVAQQPSCPTCRTPPKSNTAQCCMQQQYHMPLLAWRAS